MLFSCIWLCSCATATSARKTCAECGASASSVCSRRRSRAYCSREHQAADWRKGHKLDCIGGRNWHMHALMSAGPRCQVRHPQHLREERGGLIDGGYGATQHFHCGACSAACERGVSARVFACSLTRTPSRPLDYHIWHGDTFTVHGSEWCFVGRHTAESLAETEGLDDIDDLDISDAEAACGCILRQLRRPPCLSARSCPGCASGPVARARRPTRRH